MGFLDRVRLRVSSGSGTEAGSCAMRWCDDYSSHRASVEPGQTPKWRRCASGPVSRVRFVFVLGAVLLLGLLAACGTGTSGEQTVAEPTGAAQGPSQEAASDTPTEIVEEEAFASPTNASGGVRGAADSIREVEFEVLAGYERVIIKFGQGGDDVATVPKWSLNIPDQGGYVRMSFPGVNSTEVAERRFIGSIMADLYVVKDSEGGLFVDVFPADEFRYRVVELEPGWLAVDFQSVRGELAYPVVRGERIVVTQPREGETVSGPLLVRGYHSGHEESPKTVTLLDHNGNTLASETIPTPRDTEPWQYFETSLTVPEYDGLATLLVGENPNTGNFPGIEVPVIFSFG